MQELDKKIKLIDEEIYKLEISDKNVNKIKIKTLEKRRQKIKEYSYKNMTPSDRVFLARHTKRPNSKKYINTIFTGFFELNGDRLSNNDKSIIGGIALLKNKPVMIIAHLKGETLEENVECNFGMPSPSGYRKVQRLAKHAQKFSMPIITFIDTPGAYPGIEAEKQGQGEAIAKCLTLFSDISVPVISVIIGEGGSGGALALGVANTVVMLENSIYSILSPEGFATILWKDLSRKDEACEMMKLTAKDLKDMGIIDNIILEGVGSVIENEKAVMEELENFLSKEVQKLSKQSKNTLKQSRYEKFRNMGIY